MRNAWIAVTAAVIVGTSAQAQIKSRPAAPGCEQKTAQECVALALDAMGGRERLEQLKSVRLQTIGHTLLVEQSYRQAPFIASYERGQTILDLANQRMLREGKLTWPEADPNQSDADFAWVAGLEGGVTRGKNGDAPCSLDNLDVAQEN